MSVRFIALIASTLLVAGCNYQRVPDPNLSAKDAEYIALVPKFDVGSTYERYIIEDPTGQAPGTITVDSKQNFLYLSQPGGKAIRYGVGTGREAAGWTGTADIMRKEEWPHWMPPSDMLERWPHLKPTADAGGLPGGPDNPLGARAVPVSGQQGHAVPHPRHQRAGNDRSRRLVGLHPDAQHRRDRPLQPREARNEGGGAVSTAMRLQARNAPGPAIVTSTISGGRMKRTGIKDVPSPAEITRWRSFSTMWP